MALQVSMESQLQEADDAHTKRMNAMHKNYTDKLNLLQKEMEMCLDSCAELDKMPKMSRFLLHCVSPRTSRLKSKLS